MLITLFVLGLQAEAFIPFDYKNNKVWKTGHDQSMKVSCAPTEQKAKEYTHKLGTGKNFTDVTKKINDKDTVISWANAQDKDGILLRYSWQTDKILEVYLFGITNINDNRITSALELYCELYGIFSPIKTEQFSREDKFHQDMEIVPVPVQFDDSWRIVNIPKPDAPIEDKQDLVKELHDKVVGLLNQQTPQIIPVTHQYKPTNDRRADQFYEDVQISFLNATTDKIGHEFLTKYKKVALLIMANAVRLGGGVRNGEVAQEESMMREFVELWLSYLDYMERHLPNLPLDKKLRNIEIYKNPYISPKDVLCTHIPQPNSKEFVMLAGALPNLTGKEPLQINDYFGDAQIYNEYCKDIVAGGKFKDVDGYKKLIKENIRNVIFAARDSGCEALILGAWGCGVYKHEPATVAELFKEVLEESVELEGKKHQLKNYFKEIVFAIYDTSGERLKAFQDAFTCTKKESGSK